MMFKKTESKFSPTSPAKKLFKCIKLLKPFKLCRISPILSCFCQSYSVFNLFNSIEDYNMHEINLLFNYVGKQIMASQFIFTESEK